MVIAEGYRAAFKHGRNRGRPRGGETGAGENLRPDALSGLGCGSDAEFLIVRKLRRVMDQNDSRTVLQLICVRRERLMDDERVLR